MKVSMKWLGAASFVLATIVGCGGGNDGGGTPSPPPPDLSQLAPAIASAAAVPANDSATNQTAPFTVIQSAGLPAVSLNGPLRVNFTVFSNGGVVRNLTATDVGLAIARLVPGTNGNPDQWVNYISSKATATAGVGPGGQVSPPASAMQATNDPKVSDSQLVFNSAGYYTYTFTADITNPGWAATVGGVEYATNGVEFVPGATHRVAIRLSYRNASGEVVRVNPYFDFTFAANGTAFNSAALTNAATQSSQISTVSTCNNCHGKLALHGGGMVATQYCVMCHNPGTTDPNSGNVLTFSTMSHKIHAGRGLAAHPEGEKYVIWGFQDTEHDYSDVGYPQDLRNCSNCHSSSPATPQGDDWRSSVTQEACLTCHPGKVGSAWETTHKVYAQTLVSPGAAAADLSNALCAGCHSAGGQLSAEVVHWPQQQVNQALYKMNIESTTLNNTANGKGRSVTVKYFLSNPTDFNRPYRLLVNAADCTANTDGTLSNCSDAKFGNLKLYLAYQNVVNQPQGVTDFSAYNNGGNLAFACAFEGPVTTGTSAANACSKTAVNDGSDHYTVTIPLPDDTPTQVTFGTAMVVSVGQIKEVKLQNIPNGGVRPPVVPTVLVNTAVQHTSAQLALTGPLQPRRVVVSDQKCNVCHEVLGTASGSNTLPNAFHSGARNTVQSCSLCHDQNRYSSTVMTNGLALSENYSFKRMIHGMHASSMRTHPFTQGNNVIGAFNKAGLLTMDGLIAASTSSTVSAPVGTLFQPYSTGAVVPTGTALGTTGSPVENYAEVVRYPDAGLDCNACHVNDSWKQDPGTLGSVVAQPIDAATLKAGADPLQWVVITPKAASCSSCHDSTRAINHMVGVGGAAFGTATQAQSFQTQETCVDCHTAGGPLGVDVVHK